MLYVVPRRFEISDPIIYDCSEPLRVGLHDQQV